MGQRRPTIYDVAAHCSLAPSTVSRTFSNPSRVHPATRDIVEAAAREIGYLARPLAPVKGRTLMLVVSDIANPYYGPLIKAAQARAVSLGYTMTLTDSDESPSLEATNLRALLASCDGAILATTRLSDERIQQLARYRPLVVVNREIEGSPSLIADTAGAMRAAVRHLHALGHRELMYLSGPRNSWINSARWNAVRTQAAELGLRSGLLGPFTPNRAGGQQAGVELAGRTTTAAIAYNDLIAIGALRQLLESGVRVPEELSLIGCDDIFGSDLTTPGLTTISSPTTDLARTAVDVLHARLSNQPSSAPSSFAATLTVRESTTFCRNSKEN